MIKSRSNFLIVYIIETFAHKEKYFKCTYVNATYCYVARMIVLPIILSNKLESPAR